MAEVATQVRIYRVSDRDRYRQGHRGSDGVRAMKIAVFGAGGVGAFFGGLLVRGGADVHFVARGPQLEALRSRGIRIRSLRLGDIQFRRCTPNPMPRVSARATWSWSASRRIRRPRSSTTWRRWSS